MKVLQSFHWTMRFRNANVGSIHEAFRQHLFQNKVGMTCPVNLEFSMASIGWVTYSSISLPNAFIIIDDYDSICSSAIFFEVSRRGCNGTNYKIFLSLVWALLSKIILYKFAFRVWWFDPRGTEGFEEMFWSTRFWISRHCTILHNGYQCDSEQILSIWSVLSRTLPEI